MSIPAKERPKHLLHSRRFLVGVRYNESRLCPFVDKWGDTDVYTKCSTDFFHCPTDRIAYLVSQGLLMFKNDPPIIREWKQANSGKVPEEIVRSACAHFYERDQSRLRIAEAHERQTVPKRNLEGMKELLLRDGNVSPSSEMWTLLHYLHDMLTHKHSVYYMRPIEEVALIHGNGWHVTPQTKALYATRMGESRPDYGDYVECEFLERE